jgi:hypothetical protein
MAFDRAEGSAGTFAKVHSAVTHSGSARWYINDQTFIRDRNGRDCHRTHSHAGFDCEALDWAQPVQRQGPGPVFPGRRERDHQW